jgi:streptogramin lyase
LLLTVEVGETFAARTVITRRLQRDKRRTRRPDSRRYKPNRDFCAESSGSQPLEARSLLALSVTSFPIPMVELVKPTGITTGPDGNLWFIESGSGRIGRMTPSGALSQFPVSALPPADLPPGAPPSQGPESIVAGPDGALWFTGIPGEVGRITTSGDVSEFAVPSVPPPSGSSAGSPNSPAPLTAITVGSDGALWFTGVPGEVGRMTTSGVVTEFPVPAIPTPAGSAPGTAGSPVTLQAIVTGPDGALWFTGVPGEIGRMTRSGVVTEFPVPATPSAIAAGPGGALWFTGVTGEVSRITTSGVVTEFAEPQVPPPAGSPPYLTSYTPYLQSIIAGPDGNLWVTADLDGGNGQPSGIGRLTPSGVFTFFTVPGFFNSLLDLTAGPDGDVWFLEQEDGQTAGERAALGEITPAGVTTLHPLPQETTLDSSQGVPVNAGSITSGPDGALWFAENGAIGRITTDGTLHQFPLTIPGATAQAITSGRVGSIWFDQEVNDVNDSGYEGWSIGRIKTSGTITNYPLPLGTTVEGITEDRKGTLWFANDFSDPNTSVSSVSIGRITPDGKIQTFPVKLPRSDQSPELDAITTGPDGQVYFIGGYSDKKGNSHSFLGQVTAKGHIQLTTLPVSVQSRWYSGNSSYADDVSSLIAGPDGKLWFAAEKRSIPGIARVSTSGKLESFIPDGVDGDLVRAPHQQVWLPGSNTGSDNSSSMTIVTRSGIVATRDLPTLSSGNGYYQYSVGTNMTLGPDGNLWGTTGSSIVRLTGLDPPAGGLDNQARPRHAPDFIAGQPESNWTNVSSSAHPTFEGVAKPGAEVTLWVQKQGASESVSIGKVRASRSDGSWTLKSHRRLSDGAYAVTATQAGDSGNPGVLYSLDPGYDGGLPNALVIPDEESGEGSRRGV